MRVCRDQSSRRLLVGPSRPRLPVQRVHVAHLLHDTLKLRPRAFRPLANSSEESMTEFRDRRGRPLACPSCYALLRDPATIATGGDNRVLPLTEAELDLAEHVGAVIIAAGALDAALIALAGVVDGWDVQHALDAWGQSGLQLSRMVRKRVEGMEAPDQDVLAILDAYDTLYETRNHLVHSFRVPDQESGDHDRALRMPRGTRKLPLSPSQATFVERKLGISELIDLWYAIDELTHDVRRLFIARVTAEGGASR